MFPPPLIDLFENKVTGSVPIASGRPQEEAGGVDGGPEHHQRRTASQRVSRGEGAETPTGSPWVRGAGGGGTGEAQEEGDQSSSLGGFLGRHSEPTKDSINPVNLL